MKNSRNYFFQHEKKSRNFSIHTVNGTGHIIMVTCERLALTGARLALTGARVDSTSRSSVNPL
jgi:hypothetical protein